MFFTFPKDTFTQKSEDNRSFDELYATYVKGAFEEKCQGNTLTCKEFYLAQATAIQAPHIAIVYFQKAYEHNISSQLNDPSARDNNLFSDLANAYALLEDLPNAKTWYERSVEAGEERNICKLGKIYRDMKNNEKAYDLFKQGHEKHFEECTQELGTFYFNGTYVAKDTHLGSTLWKEAYQEDVFGIDINYNMAVYHANISNDLNRYKYHLLKAALQGDGEAKGYLTEKVVQGRNVSELFLEEAIRDDIYYSDTLVGNRFSYGFNLYYRFVKFYNPKALWQEVNEGIEADTVVFHKNGATIVFGLKTMRIEKDSLDTASLDEELRLLIDTLYVDTPEEILEYLRQGTESLKKAISHNKVYAQKKEMGPLMEWHFSYEPDSLKSVFEIRLK